MKRFFAILATSALLLSCGDDKSKEGSITQENKNESSDNSSSTTVDYSKKAVILWDGGTIDKPNTKEGKWVASYQFGNTLTLTGETEENTEEKKNYVEVTGPDGKTGWINEYLIVKNSYVGVALADVGLYKNPDVMSISSDKVKKGDIVAISAEDKSGFREVFTKEKKVKGYVNVLSNFSEDPLDLKVTVLYKKALWKKTNEEKASELQAILDDGANANSKVLEIVRAKLEEINPPVIEENPVLDSAASTL